MKSKNVIGLVFGIILAIIASFFPFNVAWPFLLIGGFFVGFNFPKLLKSHEDI
jgi:hypothetical protein